MNISTKIFRRCEIVVHSNKTYENPFADVDINATFTHEDGTVIAIPGFWNGENEWKVRFISEKTGKWNYEITCTDESNTSLCDSGVIEATYAEPRNDLEKHGYVKLTKGMRYLTYADGTPFFYLADTHWQMADYERTGECNYPGCNCGSQFKHLVDDRVKKGFTAYQTYFDSAMSDGGGNKRVHFWWTDETYTKINPQAFNESMDIMMEYLAEVGLTTAIGFGVHIASMGAYQSAEPLKKFARYCVARYACYPVMWLSGQEINNKNYDAFDAYRAASALVGEIDGFKRPNGAHMYPTFADAPMAKELDGDDWHQMWYLQAGHGGFNALKKRFFYQGYYENEKVKPFIETECQYEDIYCGGFNGHDPSRIGAWQAVQSGSAGFTYGVTGVWAMRWNATDDNGWATYSPEPWYIGMDKPGSAEMGYLKKFFDYVGWYKLTPSYNHEFGAFEMRKHVSISHIDKDLIIYYMFAPEDETGTFLGLKPNTRYQARWFDPVNGKFIDAPDVITENGEYPIPSKPSQRDWVFLLNTYDLGEYETEVYPEIKKPAAVVDLKLGDEVKVTAVKALSEDPEHPAYNLIDGNEETYWAPLAHATCQVFEFDLESAEDVKYIEFVSNNPTLMYIRFRVYGSVDGVTYTDILAERANMIVGVGGPWPKFIDFLEGDKKYKKIKLFINSTSDKDPKRQLTKIGFYKA